MRSENPFEAHVRTYDAWFDEHAPVFGAEIAAVRRVLPPPGEWIEIGVGTGRFAAALGIPRGIEPAFGMGAVARERGIDVIEAAAERLPLPDASVDCAFLITVLCFVDDLQRTFSEAARLVRPGGAAIVAFLPRESALGRQIAETASDDVFFRHATLRGRSEIYHGLRNAGFTIDRTVQTLIGPPHAFERTAQEPIEGDDAGSFVVVRAIRTAPRIDFGAPTSSVSARRLTSISAPRPALTSARCLA